jgi:peptidyl-tRNA hydrolase
MAEKVYIVIRRDLKMRRGKEIAQACHAMAGLVRKWPGVENLAVIVGRVDTDIDLLRVADLRVMKVVIWDAGLTEVEPGTMTCAAFVAEDVPGLELY